MALFSTVPLFLNTLSLQKGGMEGEDGGEDGGREGRVIQE